MPAFNVYVIFLRPEQSPEVFQAFIGMAFKAEVVGIDTAAGGIYVKMDRRWFGQFEAMLAGKFPPFEGVLRYEFLETV